MAAYRNCKWLKETVISDQASTLECVRPDKTGNLKAHKDVEGCDQYEPYEPLYWDEENGTIVLEL